MCEFSDHWLGGLAPSQGAQFEKFFSQKIVIFITIWSHAEDIGLKIKTKHQVYWHNRPSCLCKISGQGGLAP